MEKSAYRAILQNEPVPLYGKGPRLSRNISKENAAFRRTPLLPFAMLYAPPTKGKNSSSPRPLEADSSATKT